MGFEDRILEGLSKLSSRWLASPWEGQLAGLGLREVEACQTVE